MSEIERENPGSNVPFGVTLGQDASLVATPVLGKNDEVLELGDNFNLGDFQVVRREFFAHLSEPSITFNNYKFYVNKACLNKFPNTDYVQVLVDRESKMLALKPCSENARDSLLWCRVSKGKREPKQTTCKLLCMKVAALMNWNLLHRYKLLGKLIHANGEYLIAFDLTSTEVYQRSYPDGEMPTTAKVPVYPEEWKNQFGMPFYEHQQSMRISTFDGYAIYAIKDKAKRGNKLQEAQASAEDQT